MTMVPSIRRKLYAIALVVLAPTAASVAVSQYLLADARDDVALVAERLVPAATALGRVDRLFQRQVSLQDAADDESFRQSGEAVRKKLVAAEAELTHDSPSTHVAERSVWLAGHLADIRARHRAYEEAVAEGADEATARLRRNELDRAIQRVLLTVDALAKDSARRAGTHESFALRLNLILLAIAAVGGLGLATLFGRRLVATVRRVADALARVAAGDRDLAVRAETKDEAGYLADRFNDMVTALRRRKDGSESR